MNSLQDLNGYSDDRLQFADTRTTTVIWDRPGPVNQEIVANEGGTIVSTEGINIIDIVNMSAYNDVIYEFDVSAFQDPANLTVNYTVPSGVTFTKVGNNYKFGNLQTKSDWDAVKNPSIILPRDFSGTVTFFPRVHWNANTNGHTWQTTVNVLEYAEMSEPVGPVTYTVNANIKVTGTPQILDVENPDNQFNVYTMTITSSSPNYTFPGVLQAFSSSGGTATWNAASGNLVITGSKTQANVFLNNLYYTANVSGLDEDFYLYYTLKNPGSGFVTTKQQFFENSNNAIITRPTATSYNEDTNFVVTGYPQILHNDPSNDVFTLTLQGNTTAAYTRIYANNNPGLGTVTWNSSTKSLALFGTKNIINDKLTNIYIVPATDFSNNWILNYSLLQSGSGGVKAARPQPVLISQTNDEVTNLQYTRYFVKNRGEKLFPNLVPQIDETIAGNPTYTVSIYSPFGRMAANANVATTSYVLNLTGTKANVNSRIGDIYFWPSKNVYSVIPIYYSQSRNGVPQIQNQVINAIGADNLDPPEGTGLYTFTSSTTWQPTISQSMYTLANVLIVGGGSASSGYVGGSGGGVFAANSLVIPENATFTFEIGAGGSSKGASGGYTRMLSSLNSHILQTGSGPAFTSQITGNIEAVNYNGAYMGADSQWDFYPARNISWHILAFGGINGSRAGGVYLGRQSVYTPSAYGAHWGKSGEPLQPLAGNPVAPKNWWEFDHWRDGRLNPMLLSYGSQYTNSNVGGIYSGNFTTDPLQRGSYGHGAGGWSLVQQFSQDPGRYFGNGGPGISSNITGNVTVYGAGGAVTANICLPFIPCAIQTNVYGGSGGVAGGNIGQAGTTYGTGGGCATTTTGWHAGQQGVAYVRLY